MTTLSEPRTGEMLGTLLGNYRVLSKLGEGGMGVVYVGRHEKLGHSVAVKVLQPELSRDAEMVQRFFNEAQAAAAIRNLGIVQVFDFGSTADGRAYFVMELLEGESLAARLKQRRIGYLECCRIGRQIANVLQAAHAQGITHRDLKPENLFLVPDSEAMGGERVKVLDFGIAKLAGEVGTPAMKTRTGLLMGTPHYMSPEQCRGAGTVDARSDIYALGCILFQMACGRQPFVGEGAGEIVGAHLYLEVPQPRSLAPDIPPGLAALIMNMLAKRPDARPQSMSAVSAALDEIMHSFGAPARPATPVPMPSPVPVPASMPSPVPVPMTSPAPAHMQGPVPAPTPPARPQAMRTVGQRPPSLSEGSTMFRDSTEVSSTRPGAPARTSTRRLGLGFAGLVVAGVLGTVIVVGARDSGSDPGSQERGGREDTAAPGSPDAGSAEAEIVVTPTSTPDAEESSPPPPSPPDAAEVGSSELEVECLRYQAERSWGELDSCATRLMATNPSAGKDFKSRAALETKAQGPIGRFEAALQSRDLKKAAEELRQIPNTALDYQKLKAQYGQAESAAIAAVVQRLKAATAGGNCREKEYDQILAQERASKPARVAEEAKRQVKCRRTPVSDASQRCDADALVNKAIEQYSTAQLAPALASFEAAWSCKPEPGYAEKAFITACNLANAGKARLFWKRMTPMMKQRAVNICVRNGITQDMLDGN